MSRGDLDGASSTLDRALRIEPNNPLLWIELGRLRLAESDAHQAEGCGRKALVLASGDHGTQAQAGRLLADALRAQQRNQEARRGRAPTVHAIISGTQSARLDEQRRGALESEQKLRTRSQSRNKVSAGAPCLYSTTSVWLESADE